MESTFEKFYFYFRNYIRLLPYPLSVVELRPWSSLILDQLNLAERFVKVVHA